MRASFAFLFVPLALACNTSVALGPQNGVAMQDTFALDLFGPPTDAINTPYVAGAKFDVDLVATGVDTKGWTITSSDPGVLRVDAPASAQALDFPVTAVATGHTVLSIVDAKGTVVHTHDVDVDEPDTVELHSHGLMLAGLPDAQSKLSHVNVVDGGAATLLVRYFKGAQELWGNGAVTTSAAGSVVAKTTQSYLGDARDWIEIDAAGSGSAQVTLSVGGRAVAVVPVNVVGASDIARIDLLGQSDSQAQEGQSLYVFARATDAQNDDVYGASFSWEVDGSAVASSPIVGVPADLLTYQFTSSKSEAVSAGVDGFTSSLSVHGKGGTVESTSDVACSVSRGPGGAGSTGALALALGAIAAAAARRRLSRSASPSGSPARAR